MPQPAGKDHSFEAFSSKDLSSGKQQKIQIKPQLLCFVWYQVDPEIPSLHIANFISCMCSVPILCLDLDTGIKKKL